MNSIFILSCEILLTLCNIVYKQQMLVYYSPWPTSSLNVQILLIFISALCVHIIEVILFSD